MAKTVLCFCRDITADDVARAVAEGYGDMETLKRFTEAFTGPCEGSVWPGTPSGVSGRTDGTSRRRSARATHEAAGIAHEVRHARSA